MDLKIKFGAAQEVDFTEFLGTTDISNIMYGEWINLLLGKPTHGIPQEFIDEYKNGKNYSFSDIFDYIWEHAIEWVEPKLKGWGGREQAAYTHEFLYRIGFKRVKIRDRCKWVVA